MAKQFRSLWARLFHAFVVACYTPVRISIALTIRSLDPALGLTKAGAQCAPYGIAQERNGVFKKKGSSIAFAIRSFDWFQGTSSTRNEFSNRLLWRFEQVRNEDELSLPLNCRTHEPASVAYVSPMECDDRVVSISPSPPDEAMA